MVKMGKLKQRREQLGMTLTELERRSGIGKSNIKKWEDGTVANMRRDSILRYADALNVSPLFILYGDNYDEFMDNAALALKPTESKMLDIMKKLNTEGEFEAVKRLEELASLDRYSKK